MNQRNFKDSPEKVIQMVRDGIMPQRIFCYQKFDPDGHTLDIFRNKELYFAQRDQLNDPFEFKVYPSTVPVEHIVQNAPDGCFNQAFTREELQKKLTEADAIKFICQSIDDVMGEKGIKCFTPHPDKLLMWAHYAASHTGLCLEFDVMECPDYFSYPIKVIYKQEYPKIDFSSKNEREMMYSVKSDDWAYEDEIRVIKLKSKTYPFPPKTLKSVIFGCRASKDNIRKVRDIIKNDPDLNHIRIKIASTDKYSFKVNIHDLSI